MRLRTEEKLYTSFDGRIRRRVTFQRPDRYVHLESDLGRVPRIAYGGGYSYSAANFGGGSLVLEMTRFNRVMALDTDRQTLKIEAGATLADVFDLTVPRGLWLPILPGYPEITMGGCIAANVHGKNPFRDGTFRNVLLDLTLYHPHKGMLELSRENDSELFELTVGGYGLTGIIVSATIQLDPLPGHCVIITKKQVRCLEEAVDLLEEKAKSASFAYSFHYPHLSEQGFGTGFVYTGDLISAEGALNDSRPGYRPVSSSSRACLPFSVWGGKRTAVLLRVHSCIESLRAESRRVTLFEASFPFVNNESYFLLYGKKGLIESQLIVPHDALKRFLGALSKLVMEKRPPAVMMSLKLFKGIEKFLYFEGDGVCFTIDMAFTQPALEFMRSLDDLTMEVGAIPNIIKDSRLPRAVVSACYPQYEITRDRLARHDPDRLFRSELSERLGL